MRAVRLLTESGKVLDGTRLTEPPFSHGTPFHGTPLKTTPPSKDDTPS